MMKVLKNQRFLLVAVIALGLLFTQCSKDSAVQKFLELQVKALNTQCPMTIAPGIVLTDSEVLGNKTLRSNYTLSNVDESLLSDTIKFKESVKPDVIAGLKATPEMKQYNKLGITLIYRYKDQNGKYLYQLEITPEDYK